MINYFFGAPVTRISFLSRVRRRFIYICDSVIVVRFCGARGNGVPRPLNARIDISLLRVQYIRPEGIRDAGSGRGGGGLTSGPRVSPGLMSVFSPVSYTARVPAVYAVVCPLNWISLDIAAGRIIPAIGRSTPAAVPVRRVNR